MGMKLVISSSLEDRPPSVFAISIQTVPSLGLWPNVARFEYAYRQISQMLYGWVESTTTRERLEGGAEIVREQARGGSSSAVGKGFLRIHVRI